MNYTIPSSCEGIAGPITVRREPPADDDAMGTWNWTTRMIYVAPCTSPAAEMQTFYHELAHSWLRDSGLEKLVSDEKCEALVIAISTGLLRFLHTETPDP